MKSPDFDSMGTVFNTQSHFSHFKNNNNNTKQQHVLRSTLSLNSVHFLGQVYIIKLQMVLFLLSSRYHSCLDRRRLHLLPAHQYFQLTALQNRKGNL